MYRRPYLTAAWLALVSVVGIAGQMVMEGAVNTLFLLLSAVPLVLGVARFRRR